MDVLRIDSVPWFVGNSGTSRLQGRASFVTHIVVSFGVVWFAWFRFEPEMKGRIKEWLDPELWMYKDDNPNDHYLSYLFGLLSLSGLLWIVHFASLGRSGSLKEFARDFGVSFKRLSAAAREIERKTFHVAALIIPMIYGVLLDQGGWTQEECTRLCVTLTAVTWAADLSRLYLPIVGRNFPLQRLLREKEKNQIMGGCYLATGCTLAIALFAPPIAMASITFLVLGDMSAALIGVSFGGETVAVKLGREGNKSAEGSVAMFLVCFLIGCIVFRAAPLSEYIAAIGALVATLVELYEPFGLNDNLTIPVFSCIAITWAFQRVAQVSASLQT